MKATPMWYWLNGTPYCTDCVECDNPALSQEDIAKATRGPASEVMRCACCGSRENSDGYVPPLGVDRACRKEYETIRFADDCGPVPTFAYFVNLADRWAALSKRQRAAAIAIARGSMDTATDILGPRYLSRDDAREGLESPAWDDVTDLLFDIDEAGFEVPSQRG